MEQIYRIGIDHGYGNIKTANHIFESGVIAKESVSELAGMIVEYEGRFYEIGATHKEYQMDKVWDEDYYILTMAALAKELKDRGLCHASVILAVGLPIKWMGEQGAAFRKYLMKNKEVTFKCNDIRYHVKIEDGLSGSVYPVYEERLLQQNAYLPGRRLPGDDGRASCHGNETEEGRGTGEEENEEKENKI